MTEKRFKMLDSLEKMTAFEKKAVHSKRVDKKINQDTTVIAHIHVVGTNKLLNNLLLLFLMEKTGFKGKCIKKLQSVAPVWKTDPELPQFLLLDWTGVDRENIWSDIDSWRHANSCCSYFAFYNVDPKVGIEKMALANNIQGLFFENDPLDIISRGICCILNGDLWYSRKTLTKCILGNSSSNSLPAYDIDADVLTLREKEVLALIASGHGNQQIADKFFISIHTVKVHIYNIYRKINACNRLQAALWAAKYL